MVKKFEALIFFAKQKPEIEKINYLNKNVVGQEILTVRSTLISIFSINIGLYALEETRPRLAYFQDLLKSEDFQI